MDMSVSKLREMVKDREARWAAVHGEGLRPCESDTTREALQRENRTKGSQYWQRFQEQITDDMW